MHKPTEALAERQELNITLVATRTGSQAPGADEVMGIGLLCLRVLADTGRVGRVVASSFKGRESADVSAEVAGSDKTVRLKGRRFDRQEIDRLLSATDLVVAHDAALIRPILEQLFPALADLPWSCSHADIDWQGDEDLAQGSLENLLSWYRLAPSGGSPEEDCHALAYVLAKPLPRSGCTGFRRLIQAADAVTIECVLPGDSESATGTAILSSLGFQKQATRWRATCAHPAEAEALEAAVVDHAVTDPAFASLRMWRVDALLRFTRRSEPVAAG